MPNVTVLLLVTACSGSGTPRPAAAHPPAKVTMASGNLTFSSPASATGHVAGAARAVPTVVTRPDLGIRVGVQGRRLTAVTVRDSAGRAVPGAFGSSPGTWQTGWALSPAGRSARR